MSMFRAMQNPDTPDLPFAQSTMELATLTRSSSKYEGTRIQDYIDQQEDKKEKKRLELVRKYGEKQPTWEVVRVHVDRKGTDTWEYKYKKQDGGYVTKYSEEFLISKGKQRPFWEGGKCDCSTCRAGGCCNPFMRCAAAQPPSPKFTISTKLSRTPIQRQPKISTELLALAGVLLLA